jgi:hypothetical protein
MFQRLGGQKPGSGKCRDADHRSSDKDMEPGSINGLLEMSSFQR